MRVTHSMLMSSSLRDLDLLRSKYKKAQDAVNGRVLERPSDDPQRVVEAMDLSGAKLRFERTMRTGQDSREWLGIAETHMDTIIEHLQAARDIAIQAGGPGALEPGARAGLKQGIENIREALKRELNAQYRDQYLFAGWATDTKPFDDNAVTGGATYNGTSNEILRDIAPNLSVPINIPGDRLLAAVDFMETLSKLAAEIEAGDVQTVTTTRLEELASALDNVNKVRSDLGIRYVQIEKYEAYAQTAILNIEERLGRISGADLEVAVIQMTEAQTAYQAALVSFSKALPTSLLDYMLR